jgi:hypothetical protein
MYAEQDQSTAAPNNDQKTQATPAPTALQLIRLQSQVAKPPTTPSIKPEASEAEFKIVELPKAPEQIKMQLPPDEHPFANLDPKKAAAQLEVFEAAEDVDKMAQVLNGLNVEKAAAIAKEVVDDKTSPLGRVAMVDFLYGLALNYKESVSQNLILNRIVDSPALLQGGALLLVAARSEYPEVIPVLLRWAQNMIKMKGEAQTPREVALLVQEGLEQTIKNNEPQSLEIMFVQKVPITKEYASRLLWLVVKDNKNPLFVKILLDHGADVNYGADGYTLIAKAVDNENFEMIKAIVENGGKNLKINAFQSLEVGTALQIAIQKGLAPVDEYLRDHGANEDAPFRIQNVPKNKNGNAKPGKTNVF